MGSVNVIHLENKTITLSYTFSIKIKNKQKIFKKHTIFLQYYIHCWNKETKIRRCNIVICEIYCLLTKETEDSESNLQSHRHQAFHINPTTNRSHYNFLCKNQKKFNTIQGRPMYQFGHSMKNEKRLELVILEFTSSRGLEMEGLECSISQA